MLPLADQSENQSFTQVSNVAPRRSFFCQEKCKSFESYLFEINSDTEKEWIENKGSFFVLFANKLLISSSLHVNLMSCNTVIKMFMFINSNYFLATFFIILCFVLRKKIIHFCKPGVV